MAALVVALVEAGPAPVAMAMLFLLVETAAEATGNLAAVAVA
jgi:hypothetical protein